MASDNRFVVNLGKEKIVASRSGNEVLLEVKGKKVRGKFLLSPQKAIDLAGALRGFANDDFPKVSEPEVEGNTTHFNDPEAFFSAIGEFCQQNPGETIRSSDRPLKRQLGFEVTSSGARWAIALCRLRGAEDTLPENVVELIKTPAGRDILAQKMSRGERLTA